MLVKDSGRRLPYQNRLKDQDIKKHLPSSVKNTSSPKILKNLKQINNTPTKTSLTQSVKPKGGNAITYFSRRFSQARINSLNLKQIKTIPENLKRVKKKLSNISNFISQDPSHLKSGPYDEFLHQSLQSLHLMKSIAPVDLKQLKSKKVLINRKPGFEDKKTLIFDLDETLVHCCVNGEPADVFLEVRLPTGQFCEAGVNIRPFAQECLKRLSKNFEIFIFTASHSCYADVVCDYLDPDHNLIHARFYRESCIVSEGLYIKDLRIFANRRIKDVVLIDNTLHCAAYQIDNCIPIISWFCDRNDQELLKLIEFLDEISKVDDVRVVNRKYFNLSSFS
jgi:CTD small phosphatase-like protein 2